MMLYFNAQPVLVTTDLVEQARLRILLRKAGIPHRVRLARVSNPGKHGGLQGSQVDYSHEYTIYVRKKDFDQADKLCQENARS